MIELSGWESFRGEERQSGGYLDFRLRRDRGWWWDWCSTSACLYT
jgi:hypothetical protein